jgi:diguanylate cyclase (GGDEF)-like protein
MDRSAPSPLADEQPVPPTVQAVIDAMALRVAVLDRNGCILVANRHWRAMVLAPENSAVAMGVGDDLIAVMRRAASVPPATRALALTVADAVEAVLAGAIPDWELELPLGIDGERWDRLRVAAIAGGGAMFSVADVTDHVRTAQALQHGATHDTVTGLPNRVLLLDRIDQALRRPGRSLVAVIHLDLDRFRLLNTSLGAVTADRVLALVGARIQQTMGDGDSVARTGDDSFVVLSVAGRDESDVVLLASRVLEAVRQPMLVEGREIVLDASLGVAVAGSAFVRAADLLSDADIATTEAKAQGGGRMALAHQRLRSASVQRLVIEQALRRALERGELWLEYQPEVSLETGRVVGAEALLRWDHPTLGALAPADFIGVAEETGLIGPIGAWVLEEACREAASWRLPTPASEDLYVAVNVSAQQLAAGVLVDQVDAALRSAGLPPKRLCIEVTEGAVVQDWDVARSTLRRLRLMGVHVALDDFGTGYSSFSYLLRLPVDIVKLDASFVARLANDVQDRTIVESVVTLARRLGMQVVAEGVEDEHQRSVLERLGCHIVQGFGLGRPGDVQSLLGVVWERAGENT